jgi:hypothetical protein
MIRSYAASAPGRYARQIRISARPDKIKGDLKRRRLQSARAGLVCLSLLVVFCRFKGGIMIPPPPPYPGMADYEALY